ncbi:hypothetical protein TRFO_19473 [Tritrichomonas foetus]|uniref:Spindle and kinetochore-associated protein 2 n=1 Tax=Tritrichomonas foetus TaxID=1144522 RepID=A0A1J4KHX3_9EUKA|nr:hypothetical protein TRFO_19473 [Tritrichomonas foetus]|eukprot:OHT10991.1 hypothetical protein TRFO_19473 [Tritrichomonas foetus]
MLAAVNNLENTQNHVQNKLDEIEIQVCNDIPNSAPLFDLINRLRVAKNKLIDIKSKVIQYSQAEENLRNCISEYLEPASTIIKKSCNAPTNVHHVTTPQYQKQNREPEPSFQPEVPTLERKVRQSTPKHNANLATKTKSPIPQIVYHEVDQDELATLDTRSYGVIALNDIRELHQFIWDYFQNSDNINKVLSQKQIQDQFPKIRTLRSTLRFLRTLKRIDLTKEGNVKCVLS